MSDTATPTQDDIIEALADAGYNADADHLEGMTRRTADYYLARRFDAVRDDGTLLLFARYSDAGHKILVTTPSGVICSELTFSADTFGTRAFLASAAL